MKSGHLHSSFVMEISAISNRINGDEIESLKCKTQYRKLTCDLLILAPSTSNANSSYYAAGESRQLIVSCQILWSWTQWYSSQSWLPLSDPKRESIIISCNTKRIGFRHRYLSSQLQSVVSHAVSIDARDSCECADAKTWSAWWEVALWEDRIFVNHRALLVLLPSI